MANKRQRKIRKTLSRMADEAKGVLFPKNKKIPAKKAVKDWVQTGPTQTAFCGKAGEKSPHAF